MAEETKEGQEEMIGQYFKNLLISFDQFVNALTGGDPDEKTCTKCGNTKPLSEFETRKLKSGDISYRCSCIACGNARRKKWKQDNRELHNLRGREYYAANKEKKKEAHKSYYQKNSSDWTDRFKQKYYNDPEWLNKYKQRNIEYNKNNPHVRRKAVAKRRVAQLTAMPAWADKNKIDSIYKNCPDGYEVDHIVPIQGKIVSGLHVEYNLQYLPMRENRSKGNKYVCC